MANLSKQQIEEFQSGRKYYPPPPEDFTGSEPEWAIYWALTKLKAVFDFQSAMMGGRKIAGGLVADFVVYEPAMVLIRVQGEHWHYGLGTDREAYDELQKLLVGGKGFTVIDIDETDAMRAPIWYVEEAFRGIDHSLGMKKLRS